MANVRSKKLTSLILGAFILGSSSLVAQAAPAVPEPGQSLEAPPEKTAEEIANTAPDAEIKENVRFTLASISIDHEGMNLSDEEMAALVAEYVDKEMTTLELNQAVAKITRYARTHGYPAATAYIPEQMAHGGNLLVKIEAGKYGEITIDNQSRLKTRIAKGIAAGMKEGDTVKTVGLETALYNLRDLNGGMEVVGVLSPGAKQGTSDLNIKITDRKSTNFILYTENYGSRSAGRYRYGLQGDWYNPFGAGGKFNAGVLISNSHQHNYNFGYEMPVGHSATKIGIGFSRSDYELGSAFSALGAKGIADTLSIYGKTPLVNTSSYTHNLVYGYNYRHITDELTRYNFSWKKHSHAFHLGFDGLIRSRKSALSYNVGGITGTLVPDSEAAEVLATAGGTKGHFTKGTADLSYWQKLGKSFDLTAKLSGQIAANNLDSSEHLYLGGAKGVRAYPQGEASGDQGILGSLEFRYHTPVKGLTLSAFYDMGHVKIDKNGSDNMTLKGWGVAVMYAKPEDWFVRVDYARRIGSDELMSKDADARGRIWFLAGKIF